MLQLLAQTVSPSQVITWILLGVLALVGLFIFFVMLGVLKLYVQALFSDAKVAMLDLVMMRLRKVPPEVIVLNRITAKKAGIDIPTDLMEAHYLARGNVSRGVGWNLYGSAYSSQTHEIRVPSLAKIGDHLIPVLFIKQFIA
jgi:uncharacterized protein YqfA (UPF0365 family)